MAKKAKKKSDKPRKVRADKRPDGVKFSHPLTVKMTPTARAELTKQAKAAGKQFAAEYLRELATLDRARLSLPAYDYNAAVSTPKPPENSGNPVASNPSIP